MSAPDVVAHRGARHAHADNSWAAFDAAVEEGADAIECDVQLSADGVLVVRHDLVLGDALVAELPFAEIVHREPETVAFVDLVAWQAQRTVGLLVEIKDRAAEAALAGAVPADADDYVVAGFDALAVAAFKARRPDVSTSVMIGSVVTPEEMVGLARRHGADGVHPCWEARAPRASALLSRADVAALHAAGLRVTLWHEERPDELARLIALGVDAICTDTPAVLRALIAERWGGSD